LRTEHTYVQDGVRYRVVEQPRKRYPPKPLQRTRYAGADPDPAPALAELDDEYRQMAERVLREGAFTWRRWSTIRRRSGPNFSPYAVEIELLDSLCRDAGLTVIDAFRNGEWVPHRFRIDDRVRLWLGIEGPELIAQPAEELTEPALLAALEAGPPAGFTWRSFAFVLRACEQLHQFARHGVRPGKRELAGLVDHTKAWTPARIMLVEQLMGTPFSRLVATVDRQLALRGPVAHAEGGVWASRIEEIDVQVTDDARLAVLVENLETFKYLLALADQGVVMIHIPGGPPPAEVELVSRIAVLAPDLPFYAAFDLDPAGLRIARLVAERADVELLPTLMDPKLIETASHRLELGDWDERELRRLAGHVGALEPLRAHIATGGVKVEQETLQRELEARVAALVAERSRVPSPAP
jgi:Protein of unknown function C-terminus (DUF2399)